MVPLAALYLTWWLIERPVLGGAFGRPTPEVVFRWVRSGQIGTFLALGHFQVVAALLAIVLVVGLVLAWARLSLRDFRRYAAFPAAMLVGAIVFSTLTSLGRWISGPDFARSSRYVHLGTALTLPALAVAADAIVRRWRVLTPVLAILFLIAIPWNIDQFEQPVFGPAYMARRKEVLTNVVRVPEARQVPRTVKPIPDIFLGDGVTIGFLLDAQASGKLHAPTGRMSPQLRNEMRVRLGVSQGPGGFPVSCEEHGKPLDITPDKGTLFSITTPLMIATRDGAHATSAFVPFNPGDGNTLTIDLADLDLRIAPVPGAKAFTICAGSPAP